MDDVLSVTHVLFNHKAHNELLTYITMLVTNLYFSPSDAVGGVELHEHRALLHHKKYSPIRRWIHWLWHSTASP